MHIRFSSCIGLPIVDDSTDDTVGMIHGILVDPDKGAVEGFAVTQSGFGLKHVSFLSTLDIRRFGAAVHVGHPSVIGDAEDIVRLQGVLADTRRVIDQRMCTESGMQLGVCRDVQINTKTWHVEWLFPRRFFRWGTPVSIAQVIDVTEKAILLRDPVVPEDDEGEPEHLLPVVGEPRIA